MTQIIQLYVKDGVPFYLGSNTEDGRSTPDVSVAILTHDRNVEFWLDHAKCAGFESARLVEVQVVPLVANGVKFNEVRLCQT